MIVAQKAARTLIAIPVLVLVLLCVSCAETTTPSLTVKIGAGAPAGIYDDLVRNIARVVNEYEATTGIRLERVLTTGSVANINAVAAGDLQFGIAQGLGGVSLEAVGGRRAQEVSSWPPPAA